MTRDHENSNESPDIFSLMTWLSGQFTPIHRALGELHSGMLTNRQTTIEVHRHLTGRMDQLTMRMDTLKDIKKNGNGNGSPGWIKLVPWKQIPWVKMLLIISATILVITGHITVPQVQEWLIAKIKSI